MALDFRQICNFVLARIDEERLNDGTAFGAATSNEFYRIKEDVNNIYRELFDEKVDWSWAQHVDTLTTVSGQKNYAKGGTAYTVDANADLQNLFMVQVGTDPTMEILSYQEFKRKYGQYEGTTTGKPYVAYVLNDHLYLYPTPDDAYTVNYICKKLFSELTDHDDEPLIPDGKRDVLCWGALWLSKQHEHEATFEFQQYQKRLQAIRSAEGNNHKGFAMIPEDETVTAEYQQIILLE